MIQKAREFAELKKKRPEIQFELYKKIFQDERHTSYKFGHRPNLSIKLEKGYYHTTVITNSVGLREKIDYTSLNESIIFLGDSIVEGLSVENDETMDSVFERITGIPSLNFGVATRGTFLEYQFLKSKYKRPYNTKLVVLGFCLNDFFEAPYIRYFDETYGNWFLLRYLDKGYDLQKGLIFNLAKIPVIGWLFKKCHEIALESEIVKSLRRESQAMKKLSSIKTALPYSSQIVARDQRLFTENHLRLLKSFVQSIQAKLIVVIFPTAPQFSISYGPHERMQNVLIDILLRNNIQYIDLFDAFKYRLRDQPQTPLFIDDTHLNKAGHEFVANYLAASLRQIYPEMFSNF